MTSQYSEADVKGVNIEVTVPGADSFATAFVLAFNALAIEHHHAMTRAGFNDRDGGDAEAFALMHSEISEALEGARHGDPPDDKIPEFSACEAEMADLLLRVMHRAHKRGWRVAEALVAKMKFNHTRPAMHGGKLF